MRSSSSHAVGALLSLPTIDESTYHSDSESTGRSSRTPSVSGGENHPDSVVLSSLLSDIVWDAKCAAEKPRRKAPLDADEEGLRRSSSILNSSNDSRKDSPHRSTRRGVRLSFAPEVKVEWPAQNHQRTSRPELEHPKAKPSSRRKNSDGSTSSDDSPRSQETLVPELQQIAQDDAAAAPSSLDLNANSTPSSNSERRSNEDCPKAFCFKSSPRKYRQCLTYLVALTLLTCSATLLTVAIKVVQANHGASSAVNASNTTGTGVNNPTTAPVALSTAAPTNAPTHVPIHMVTAVPTVAPVAVIDSNDTNVRDPLLFLNCGGPPLQFKSHIWQSDRLYPQFIIGKSRTNGRDADPLCLEFVSPVNSTNDDLSVVRDGNFDALFCSERFFPLETGGGYEIQVPAAGEYRVELYFREDFYNMSRQRVFNISVENELIRQDFDILLRAGGPHLPTKVVSTMLVEDGALSISMRASIGNPTINALALYRMVEQQ
jgi:Malectin domain